MSEWLFDVGRGRETPSLRPYQVQAVRCVEDFWANATSGPSSLCIAATGCGKTEIASELIRRGVSQGHGSLLIEPFIDLVSQTAARLRSRGVACGIEQAQFRSDEQVTVACYASLLSRQRWQQFIGRVSRVIVDEVHLNFSPASMRMLDAFVESGCKVLGLTATPDRGGDPLTKWYGHTAFCYPYHSALDDGWLVPAKIWLTVLNDLDLSAFKKVHGDFDQPELRRIMAQEENVQSIASMVEQHHDGQPSVVFCQSIRQSEQLRNNLSRRGINSSIVHSEMPPEERRMHLRDFEEGANGIILNVGCLCVGWDWPPIRKVFIAKPTLSRAKYGQMFGRGVRPLPGIVDRHNTPADRKAAIAASEKDCFELFDITDSSRRCDLRTAVDVLYPEESEVILKRVRRAVEKSQGTLDVDAVLEAERAAEAREQAARDALTEHLRGDLIADGTFSNYERSVLAQAEEDDRRMRAKQKQWNVMPFGKYKRQPFAAIPTGYLQWVLREGNVRGPLRAAIEKSIESRRGDAW